MDLHRLRVLLELSRLGSMHAVAESMHTSTSTVSQQIATLSREAGARLVEPDGRRVRLTPAGRRLADHALGIVAAVDAARRDLDPDAEPTGAVLVAGFATAIRRSLLPVVDLLAQTHPGVTVSIHEYEPLESLDLIAADDVDLALVYDYNLAPVTFGRDLVVQPLWEVPWGLGVPSAARPRAAASRPADLSAYAGHDWIVNSRNTADEDVVRTLASLVGFTPRVVHRIDSLELLEELVVAGRGVGLLPLDRPTIPGVSVLPVAAPGAVLRASAVVRRGRDAWPPLRLVLDQIT